MGGSLSKRIRGGGGPGRGGRNDPRNGNDHDDVQQQESSPKGQQQFSLSSSSSTVLPPQEQLLLQPSSKGQGRCCEEKGKRPTESANRQENGHDCRRVSVGRGADASQTTDSHLGGRCGGRGDTISFEDYLGLTTALYEWADSYDAKDWDRLRKVLAPTLRVDYRSFLDKFWEAMPAEDFVSMISSDTVLGNPLLRTQHFVGATRWEKISDTEVVGWHQLRVPHQRYELVGDEADAKPTIHTFPPTPTSTQDPTGKGLTDKLLQSTVESNPVTTIKDLQGRPMKVRVTVKGHAHSANQHWYRKENGVWKFAGLNPDIRWHEYDFDRIFADGRDTYGESVKR